MTIHRLLDKSVFDPDDIQCLVAAYEQTLRTLHLQNRDEPLTRFIAGTVIRVGQTGIRDPARISEMTIKQLDLP